MSQEFVHPELREGEVFLGNFTDEDYKRHCGWKTKHMGVQLYGKNSRPLGHIDSTVLHPVFAMKSELDEAGITISH